MTQPVFGQHAFGDEHLAPPKDAFDVVTGELLQQLRAQQPERRYLVDESIVDVAQKLNAPTVTQHVSDMAKAPYLGVWLVVRFPLGDHVSRFGMEIVSPQAVDEKHRQRLGLTCIFDTEPWHESIATYRVGALMTVAGQIEQLGAFAIRLRNCELVGVNATPA